MKTRTRSDLERAAGQSTPSTIRPPSPATTRVANGESGSLVDQHLKIAGIVRGLFPGEWISLRAARLHVLLALGAHVPELDQRQFLRLMIYTGKNSESDFGALATIADRETRSLLIRAFDEGKITTRGVEHFSDLSQVMHQPLPLNWWKRTFDDNDTINPVHLGYPVHVVSWVNGCIFRRRPGQEFWGEPIGTVTDIEVFEPDLHAVVKPPKEKRGTSTEDPNRWLMQEVLRRQSDDELYGRDALVHALQKKFPHIGKTEARRVVDAMPDQFRAKPGRPRKEKSGQE